jgi:hypothetical protein
MSSKSFLLMSEDHEVLVPKRSLYEFFEKETALFAAPSYKLQSTVPPDIFLEFANSLISSKKLEVTASNAGHLCSLATELCFPDLRQECEDLLATLAPPQSDAGLIERISRLEHSILSVDSPLQISERVLGLEAEFENIKQTVQKLEQQLSDAHDTIRSAAGHIRSPEPAPLHPPIVYSSPFSFLETLAPPTTSFSFSTVLPSLAMMKQVRMLSELNGKGDPMALSKGDGIIGFLSHKIPGNVCTNQLVVMTATSVLTDSPEWSVRNAADLSAFTAFLSRDEEGQSVSWDFGTRKIWVSHYLIKCSPLRSWVLEGSHDAANWVALDERVDDLSLNGTVLEQKEALFEIAGAGPVTSATWEEKTFQFVRLRQTAKNHFGDDHLMLVAVEFFGKMWDPHGTQWTTWQTFLPRDRE